MRTFSFQHRVFRTEQVHNEANLPEWIKHRAFKWFLDGHVLTLEVGGIVESDFHIIRRVE